MQRQLFLGNVQSGQTNKVFHFQGKEILLQERRLGGNVLLFSPHPDDAAISAGGILARSKTSANICIINCYSGHRGVTGDFPLDSKIKLREQESTDEAKTLGLESVCLRLSGYEQDYKNTNEDAEKLQQIIQEKQATTIFLPDFLDPHPAHRSIAIFVWEVLGKMDLEELRNIYLYETPWHFFRPGSMNTFVSLSEEELELKVKAIQCHISQIQRTPFDKAARHLASLRAIVSPEQELQEVEHVEKLGSYAECFARYSR